MMSVNLVFFFLLGFQLCRQKSIWDGANCVMPV